MNNSNEYNSSLHDLQVSGTAMEEKNGNGSGPWVKKFSERFQKDYWYHTSTKQSVWTDPAAATKPQQQTAVWEKRHSATYNRPYWVNAATGESVWTDPHAHENAASANAAEGADGRRTTGKRSAAAVDAAAVADAPMPLKKQKQLLPQREQKVVVQEDYPLLAVQREQLRQQCHELLVRLSEQHGPLRGDSKTARSCRKDGMHAGLQGVFARIMWHQLLCQIDRHGDVGSSVARDGIFPTSTVPDVAVAKEFVDFGRSEAQAEEVVLQVRQQLQRAGEQLAAVRRSLLAQLHSLPPVLLLPEPDSTRNQQQQQQSPPSALMFHRLRYESASYTISDTHLQKLLRLYKLHTDRAATQQDPVFVSNLSKICTICET